MPAPAVPTTRPRSAALSAAAVLSAALAVALVVASSTTAVAGGGKHHDPKAPPVFPEPAQLTVDHVELVQVGRGAGGGIATATVRNDGTDPALDVTVAYELGSGTTFDPDHSSSGCTAPDTLVVCPVGELGPGATAAVAVGVRVPADARIGSVRLGVFREPTSAGWDAAAGEWLGVDGRWRTRFTPIATGDAFVCALDLPERSEVRVGPVDDEGSSTEEGERVLYVGAGSTSSSPVPVTAGTAYQLEVRLPWSATGPAEGTPLERWGAVGLVADGDGCSPASAEALGVTGRWRARSGVRLVVAPGAHLEVTGAVWGDGPSGRTASVAVRNVGPDPAPAVIELLGTRTRAMPDGGCEVPSQRSTGADGAPGADRVAAHCTVAEIAAGSSATVAIGVIDGTDLGRWVANLPPTSADPAASSSQERP